MSDMPEALRRIWEIITSDEYAESRRISALHWGPFRLPRWLPDGRLNPTARRELLRQLKPFLQFEGRSKLFAASTEDQGPDSERGEITRYVSAQVRLRGGDNVQTLVIDIKEDPKNSELLADMADDLTCAWRIADFRCKSAIRHTQGYNRCILATIEVWP